MDKLIEVTQALAALKEALAAIRAHDAGTDEPTSEGNGLCADCLKTCIEEQPPASYAALEKLCQQQHEALEKAGQENAALRAKVAKLEAPVSNEEMAAHAVHYMELGPRYGPLVDTPVLTKESADALIAARGREGEVQPWDSPK